MSNAANHNDDLFRQKMEDFREMPSDNVWAGVQSALDNDKKKRRAIIWWWTGGLGIAASIIIAIFTFNYLNKTEHLYTKNSPLKSDEAFSDSSKNNNGNPNIHSYVYNNNLINGENIASSTQHNNQHIDVDASKNKVRIKNSNIESTKNKKSRIHITHPSFVKKYDDDVKMARNSEDKNVSSDQVAQQTDENTHTQQSEDIILHSVSVQTISCSPFQTIGIQLLDYPEKKLDTSLRVMACVTALPRFGPIPDLGTETTISREVVIPRRFIPAIGIYGYAGGVAYHRKLSNTNNSPQNTGKQKRFGLYAATAIKAGFTHRNGIYMNVGIGYETQRFSGREQFLVSGNTTNSPITPSENESVNTSFGSVLLPTTAQDGLSSSPQLLDGKLVYQNHQLFIPVDIGYRVGVGNFAVNVAATASFHIPISQKAIFYPDQGGSRPAIANQMAPFNLSVGIEPIIEYRVSRYMSLMAGGTFQYYVLNAYKNTSNVSRPYVLAGQLGVKFYLPRFFIPTRK